MGLFGNNNRRIEESARIEKELERIEKGLERIKELEDLVDHLKKDIRTYRGDFISQIREYNQYYVKSILDFLESDSQTADLSYMFVDKKGIIIGYTPALPKTLSTPRDLRGKNYLELLSSENPEDLKNIKKYFATPDIVSVSYNLKTDGKEIKLQITKKSPIWGPEIYLSPLGRKSNSQVIAFVPIEIKKQGIFSRSKSPNLQELINSASADKMKDIYHYLVTKCNWTADSITSYEQLHGSLGLIQEYEKLSKKSK